MGTVILNSPDLKRLIEPQAAMVSPMENEGLVIQKFRPELLSRRGEATAWVLTLVLLGGLFLVRSRLPGLSFAAYLFLGFFVFASLSISLGNWMDRQTEIKLDARGVAYKNGLRSSHLDWGEIERVSVSSSRLGDKVHVIGQEAHFHFRLLGEINYQGQTRGRVGFQEGDLIVETILEKSGLQLVETEASTRDYLRV